MHLDQELDEVAKREMLHDMKRGDGAVGLCRLTSQIPRAFFKDNIHALLLTASHSLSIEVHTPGSEPPLREKLQPLAAAAADIKHKCARSQHIGLLEDRQVGGLSLSDLFARTSEPLLEGGVEGVRYRALAGEFFAFMLSSGIAGYRSTTSEW